ncbi:MAG: hypothetical protein ACK54U_02540 [Sphingomonadales bacterium]
MTPPTPLKFKIQIMCGDEIAMGPGKEVAGGDDWDAAAMATHCAFSGLGHSALGGADPLLLATALAFILLIGIAPLPALPRRDLPFLRPQLRGPPLSA